VLLCDGRSTATAFSCFIVRPILLSFVARGRNPLIRAVRPSRGCAGYVACMPLQVYVYTCHEIPVLQYTGRVTVLYCTAGRLTFTHCCWGCVQWYCKPYTSPPASFVTSAKPRSERWENLFSLFTIRLFSSFFSLYPSGSSGRPCVLLLFLYSFFSSRDLRGQWADLGEILPRVRKRVQFINACLKNWGSAPKKILGLKNTHAKFGPISDTFPLWARIFPERIKM